MGLMDVLRGMQYGPHGQPPPAPERSGGGAGMSPITMALLGLLAYKAMKRLGGEQQQAPSPAGRAPSPPSGGDINVPRPARMLAARSLTFLGAGSEACWRPAARPAASWAAD